MNNEAMYFLNILDDGEDGAEAAAVMLGFCMAMAVLGGAGMADATRCGVDVLKELGLI